MGLMGINMFGDVRSIEELLSFGQITGEGWDGVSMFHSPTSHNFINRTLQHARNFQALN